jgi:PAS domain S-box-containing protein
LWAARSRVAVLGLLLALGAAGMVTAVVLGIHEGQEQGQETSQAVAEFAAGALLSGALVLAGLTTRVGRRMSKLGVTPVQELAEAATQIASGTGVTIPHTNRPDEIGVLANALQSWQDAAAEQRILIDQVPVGVCTINGERVMPLVNVTMAKMLGYTKEELTGRSILDLNPPEHHARTMAAFTAFMTGKRDLYVSERQWLRKDGSQIWCSLRIAPVRPQPDGPPVAMVAISEDITRQKQQALYAAQIQHRLLPQETPRIEGYDLAAACVPAENVGGDFYDWVVREDGQVDLTLADVMGKGTAAALVMATVRAAMREAPPSLGPSERVRVAAGSLSTEITDEGLFVTLFQCRLDVASGGLRYVDAGHSFSAIWRAGGQFDSLMERGMPLGVQENAAIPEGSAQLDPGDTLVIYSDGLVEMEDRTLELEEFRSEFDGSEDAAEVIRRMMDRMPANRSDDVTIVLLRRLPIS